MMVYPASFEEKIGFNRIRELLLLECRNDISKNFVKEMLFSVSYSYIIKEVGKVNEYKKMLLEVHNYPDGIVADLTPLLNTIAIPGSWFEPEYLPPLLDALVAIEGYHSYFIACQEAPLLSDMTEKIESHAHIVTAIERLLNEKGEISDDATPELAKIRKDIELARGRSERVLKKVLRESIAAGVLSKDVEYTVKNGRFVIPVPSARKRQIKGYIHDESATGQTSFIEPAEMVELSNEVRELEFAERREVIKIMSELADTIRPYLSTLNKAFSFAGMLDFIRAKARLAININGVLPAVENKSVIEWNNAIHPLLYLALKQVKREVVPLNLSLNSQQKIVVISGPNAGGKSVCLKTVGLLQFMFQCGLLIPVHENSIVGIFNSLFLDIGDEQSLENDLSTYSSHLKNMVALLGKAGPHTLFLIDELGSGTEPESGGAIAEVVLEAVSKKNAFGIVTTHYANLKQLAAKTPLMVNGAMLFDTQNMKPLYKLKVGKPGSSFAFEIAAKSGLEKSLATKAKKLIGTKRFEFEYQIQQLETEKENLEKKKGELKVADAFLADMLEKYTALYKKLDDSRKETIQKAKDEAAAILANANKIIEKTVREIRESEKSREQIKRAREGMKYEAENLLKSEPEPLPLPPKDVAIGIDKQKRAKKSADLKAKQREEPFKVGDFVTMKGSETPGKITRISAGKAMIALDNVTLEAPLGSLERSDPPEKQIRNVSVNKETLVNLDKLLNSFKPDIDVRGKRGVEAVSEVEKLINDAVFLNIKEVRVLHGKGDGILRQMIRGFLQGIPEVRSFVDEHADRGGHGITIITLK